MIAENVRIVLVRTSHPGNIGAVARAMKNMALKNLYLVDPKIFPHAEVTARAAGADDILQNAVVAATLEQALMGCHLVIGTSARERFLPIEMLNPKEAALKIVCEENLGRDIAVVFGSENSGLNNEELQLCHNHLYISTNPDFSSLNVAASVLLVAYEIKNARESFYGKDMVAEKDLAPLADFEAMEFFYGHLERVLVQTNFLDPKNPRHLMARLRRLFGRARLEKSELGILRGILTAVQKLHSFSQDEKKK